MKTFKAITTTILVLLGTLGAYAQFNMGIKGGGNFLKLTDDLSSDYRTGYHLGLFMDINANKIGIQPEVLIVSGTAEPSGGIFAGDLKFRYIAVPVMVNFNLTKFLALQLGPQFLYNTLADFTTTVAGVESTVSVRDQIEKQQWAATGGLMVRLPLGFHLSGRYVSGATNIIKSGAAESKNDFIMISIAKSFF
jgi:hypothetical protein